MISVIVRYKISMVLKVCLGDIKYKDGIGDGKIDGVMTKSQSVQRPNLISFMDSE